MLKKRNLLLLCLLILGILLLSSCFLNPPATEGILKGQVIVPEGTIQNKDLTGQALPDATVNIIDLATGAIIATTVTDATGHYQISVPPGGPYLLEAIKDGLRLEQITCPVEVGIEYDLGTADCSTTAVALIAQAMMEAGDNPVDIDCAAIIADPNFDDVSSIVCNTIQAGGDPTESAAIEEAVADFLNPPAPTPTLPSLSNVKAITAFDFKALDPEVVGVINEGAKTITLAVPFGTDVTALVPTIATTGVSVSPDSGAAQEFTLSITYTVTTEDASTQAYLVTVTVAAPVITTISTIANGAAAPSVTVTGTNFKAGIGVADLTVDIGTTTLTLDTVSYVSATEITVAFTGTAAAGEVTIQAKTSAFDPESLLASNTLNVTVPKAVINIAAISGVTVPLIGETPVTTITETAQYTGTIAWSVAWSPDDPFQSTVFYIATITLTPKAGFTLTGVAEDFFTVAGAVATNPIDSGVVTARFLVVGASYSGGKVAYILQIGDSGYDANKQHGLIAAADDAPSMMPWSNITNLLAGASGETIGTGHANTTAIVGQADCTSGAAYYCDNLTEGGYNDWFLPSKNELNKLWINRVAIGGFTDGAYWSSSETGANIAWLQFFLTGNPFNLSKLLSLLVRAVRAF